jgi:phosphomannomutase/phosphoglucomutase
MNTNKEFPDKNIFKAYDIRGVVGKTLNNSSVIQIGKSIGSEALQQNQKSICVGYDGRLSSPQILDLLSEGLLSTGINVINIGLVTTPMLYFSTYQLKTKSGIMITGSHNPPEYNGFKIVINDKTLSTDDIQILYQRIIKEEYLIGKGGVSNLDVKPAYLEKIYSDIKLARPIRVAIDCGNGAASVCAEDLYKGIGAKVELLFCSIDGNFPNHHPDPSNLKNLVSLQEALVNGESELGLAFDGDGDRLGVVTKKGEIIFPDRQLLLFAEDVLKNNPGASIIFDVKSTRHLFSWIEDRGGIPIIWKTGHSLIKAKMKESKAILAGEMSGHMFFNDRWYGFDDGVYAGARLIEILSNFDNPSKILEALPKSFSTPELNIELNEGEQHKIIKTLQNKAKFPNAIEIIKIDGLRVEYDYGFGLMRASNTTPVIVLRFEASSKKDLKLIQKDFKEILEGYIPKEKIPF